MLYSPSALYPIHPRVHAIARDLSFNTKSALSFFVVIETLGVVTGVAEHYAV